MSPYPSPFLVWINICGALDIDSKPPAIAAFVFPNAIDWEANTIDFNPDEHTLLIVVQGTYVPTPPFKEACLAGAWPIPADKTLPKMTSSIYLGFSFIESSAPLIAIPPS